MKPFSYGEQAFYKPSPDAITVRIASGRNHGMYGHVTGYYPKQGGFEVTFDYFPLSINPSMHVKKPRKRFYAYDRLEADPDQRYKLLLLLPPTCKWRDKEIARIVALKLKGDPARPLRAGYAHICTNWSEYKKVGA